MLQSNQLLFGCEFLECQLLKLLIQFGRFGSVLQICLDQLPLFFNNLVSVGFDPEPVALQRRPLGDACGNECLLVGNVLLQSVDLLIYRQSRGVGGKTLIRGIKLLLRGFVQRLLALGLGFLQFLLLLDFNFVNLGNLRFKFDPRFLLFRQLFGRVGGGFVELFLQPVAVLNEQGELLLLREPIPHVFYHERGRPVAQIRELFERLLIGLRNTRNNTGDMLRDLLQIQTQRRGDCPRKVPHPKNLMLQISKQCVERRSAMFAKSLHRCVSILQRRFEFGGADPQLN